MKKLVLSILGFVSSLCLFSQQYPFPMNEANYSYPYGIVASTPDNEKVQSKFVNWNKTMYKESSDGQYGRIRFDDQTYTVSEGIGYGMLIYVYMSNETNDFCQDRFDKLYAYYKKWSNGNGLMNWKIKGFESIVSYNAATDADLDVALALCLAAKQWGYSSKYVYADEAETILNAIYKKEVSSHTVDDQSLKVFNPGDSWNSIANPCYFTVASVGVFDQAQKLYNFSTQNDWKTVYDDCHTYLQKSQRAGLWPNWSNWDGSPAVRSYDTTSADYGWDACRTPWRIAWDYVWYGNTNSKTMLQNTIAMMDAQNILDSPSKAGYYSNLVADSYEDLVYGGNGNMSAFFGGYACALMVDETQQANLDVYHNKLKSNTESPYYSPTLQMLYLLLTSGNAANFYDLEGGAPQLVVNPIISSASTDGNKIELSCSKVMDETLTDFSDFTLYIDTKEQTNAFKSMTISGTTISLELSDEIAIVPDMGVAISYKGNSIISKQGGFLGSYLKFPVVNHVYEVGGNTILADCEDGNATLLGGGWYSYSDGSTQSYAMVLGGAAETDTSAYFTFENVKSYVGMGFNILSGEKPLDCSGSTGFSFYHKGDACILETKTITKKNNNYSYQTYDIEAHEDWTLVELKWEDVADDFITSGYVTEVTGFQWKEVTGSGSFYIDEVTLLGRSISVSETDRSYLEATLITANTLYAKATDEVYPQSAIDTFAEAISVAADVYANSVSTRSEIDTANEILNSAISTFQATAYGDKTMLSNVLEKANVLSSNAVVGTEKNMYPQSAKDELDAAIEKAQMAYDTYGLTYAEVSDAVNALTNAISKFQSALITTAIATIDCNVNVYPNPCTEFLNIESSEIITFVQIIGVNGLVWPFSINQNVAQLNVSQFSNGVYSVLIVFANGMTQKSEFVKL